MRLWVIDKRHFVSIRVSLLLAVLTVFIPAWILADDGSFDVQADGMVSLPDGTLQAEGRVVLKGRGFTARADRMRYDPERSVVHLEGNVSMTDDGGGYFTGDSLELNLDSQTGGVTEGEIFIEESGIRVRGETIKRLAPDEYEVLEGEFTACPGECPDWSFTASRLRVRKEGYVTARHAAFRLVGIPIFYTPYLFYPVKTRRQSGLLLPEVNYTDRSGWEGIWPLFITLGDTADATFTLRTFSRDETGMEGEFRYDLPWGGGGRWAGFTIGDRQDRGQDRWYYSVTHAMRLGKGLWTRGRWYDAGSPEAPVDFGKDFEERNPGAVNRHLSVEGLWGRGALWVGDVDLAPDAADAGGTMTLGRIEAGGRLGWYNLGPVDVRAAVEYTEFDEQGDRYLLRPGLFLQMGGPGPLSGKLWGQWSGSAVSDGTVEDSFVMVTLEEGMSLIKQMDWGSHRLDLSLLGARSTSFRFNEALPRDSRDTGQDHELLAGQVRSRLEGSSFSWEVVAGAWSDYERDEAMAFGRTVFRRSPWYLSATINRDAEFGLVLPLQVNGDNRWKGWSAGAGIASKEIDLQVQWESSDQNQDIATGSYRIPFRAFEFSGRAQFDLDSDRTSDEQHTVTYRAQCWELGLSRIRNLGRTDWKLSFNLGQKLSDIP
jgi:hypothetical protein